MNDNRKYTTDSAQLEKEVEIDFIRSSGPGGQHRDTSETGVRITHPLSGISVTCTDTRSQAENRAIALERLSRKLKARNRPKKKRRKTRPTRASRKKRLEHKRKRKEKKRRRKKVDPDPS